MASSSRYENLGDREIVDYQRQVMLEQDKHLESIEKSVGSLKEASVAMSQEITIQNALLDDMTNRVDATQGRMSAVRTRITGFITNTSTCRLWLLIIAAIALLVLILAYL